MVNKHIIFLAGGNSRRFSANKLICSLAGKPLFLYGLEMLTKLQDSRSDVTLTVVTQYEEIKEAALQRKVKCVCTDACRKGISYSIKEGLRSIPDAAKEDYVLFVVADQPFLSQETMEKLLLMAKPGTETASVSWEGIPGNPTLFSLTLRDELMALEGDQGGRRVIRRHACAYVEAAKKEELMDFDTPSDWERIEKERKKRYESNCGDSKTFESEDHRRKGDPPYDGPDQGNPV